MEGLRRLTAEQAPAPAVCSRCAASGCPWDRVAGHSMCPECQEQLASGDGPPLIEKVEACHCAVCERLGTLRFLTYLRHGDQALEFDLCGEHFKALLSRRLDRQAYRLLSGRLDRIGLGPRAVFLLHEAFYDDFGRCLRPVPFCGSPLSY